MQSVHGLADDVGCDLTDAIFSLICPNHHTTRHLVFCVCRRCSPCLSHFIHAGDVSMCPTRVDSILFLSLSSAKVCSIFPIRPRPSSSIHSPACARGCSPAERRLSSCSLPNPSSLCTAIELFLTIWTCVQYLLIGNYIIRTKLIGAFQFCRLFSVRMAFGLEYSWFPAFLASYLSEQFELIYLPSCRRCPGPEQRKRRIANRIKTTCFISLFETNDGSLLIDDSFAKRIFSDIKSKNACNVSDVF